MEYEDELNHRLERRWLPSSSLKPLYDSRPTSTKYTCFQSVDDPTPSNVPLMEYKEYSSSVFNPGNRAPVDYYMKSVDIESKLRSQFMALQKADQAVYIPDLSSEIYTAKGGTKEKEYTEVSNIKSRNPPTKLEPFAFGNMTRLYIKK
jgi:hypothetical protein